VIESDISWTDATFNPWWGCTKVSPACDNCYAERDSKRYGHSIWGKDAPRRFFSDKHWEAPLKWRGITEDGITRRRRVFCASMADVMEDRRDLDSWRMRLFGLIEATTDTLDWLLLSKRPRNFHRWLPTSVLDGGNVWLGTTVESPSYLWRIDDLKRTPCDIHFISCEPLVEGIPQIGDYLEDIEWVIAGGESGGMEARPANPDWFRQVRDAAVDRSIPFHFKQWGEHSSDLIRIGKKKAGYLLDGKAWREFPAVKDDGGLSL
jgi:protein gp37